MRECAAHTLCAMNYMGAKYINYWASTGKKTRRKRVYNMASKSKTINCMAYNDTKCMRSQIRQHHPTKIICVICMRITIVRCTDTCVRYCNSSSNQPFLIISTSIVVSVCFVLGSTAPKRSPVFSLYLCLAAALLLSSSSPPPRDVANVQDCIAIISLTHSQYHSSEIGELREYARFGIEE